MRRIDFVFIVLLLLIAALALHASHPRRRLVENEDSRIISAALNLFRQSAHPKARDNELFLLMPDYDKPQRPSVSDCLDTAIRFQTRGSDFAQVEKLRDLKIFRGDSLESVEIPVEPLSKLDLPAYVAIAKAGTLTSALSTRPFAQTPLGLKGQVIRQLVIGKPARTKDGRIAALMMQTDRPSGDRVAYILENRDGEWKLISPRG